MFRASEVRDKVLSNMLVVIRDQSMDQEVLRLRRQAAIHREDAQVLETEAETLLNQIDAYSNQLSAGVFKTVRKYLKAEVKARKKAASSKRIAATNQENAAARLALAIEMGPDAEDYENKKREAKVQKGDATRMESVAAKCILKAKKINGELQIILSD